MSTILNALKKLEKEKKGDGTGETIAGTGHQHVPVARQGPTPGRHGSSKWRARILVAMVVGGAAVYLFSNLPWISVFHPNRKTTEAETSSEHGKMKQPPVHLTEPAEENRAQRWEKASNKGNQFHSPPPGISSDADDRQNPPPTGSPKVSAKTSMNPEEDVQSVSLPVKRPVGRKSGPPAKEKAKPAVHNGLSGDELPEKKGENFFRNAKLLADGRLKVQAIAWSPVAQDRMAVMNNHIVHEGETVDGFSIVAIGQDDVVVKEKGQLWRVKFGRP